MLLCWYVVLHSMGTMNLTINDDLEHEFRDTAFRVKGMKKGHLTSATEEAIKVWLGYIKLKQMSKTKDNKLWPEEEQALEDIMTGKTKTVTESGADFLKRLDTIIEEQELGH
jgi:hypothetical protein